MALVNIARISMMSEQLEVQCKEDCVGSEKILLFSGSDGGSFTFVNAEGEWKIYSYVNRAGEKVFPHSAEVIASRKKYLKAQSFSFIDKAGRRVWPNSDSPDTRIAMLKEHFGSNWYGSKTDSDGEPEALPSDKGRKKVRFIDENEESKENFVEGSIKKIEIPNKVMSDAMKTTETVNMRYSSEVDRGERSNDLKEESNSGAIIHKYSFCDSELKCGCINDSLTGRGSSFDFDASNPNSTSTSSLGPFFKMSAVCCARQRNNAILVNGAFCDVTFIVGKGLQKCRFSAHKALLCAGSQIFTIMFQEIWMPASSEIEILDVEPFAFSNLLRYVYTDECNLTFETVAETLYAAKKYAILRLERLCVNFLMECVCATNAFAVLTHARSYNEVNLINSSLKAIDEETDVAISSSCFFDVDSALLRIVLERNTLNIKEIKLFNAILSWSVAKCDQNNIPINENSKKLLLEELLPLIRFPLMSIKEISSIVAPAGVLSHEELSSIFCYLSTNPKPAISFNSMPRSWKQFKVHRFQEIALGVVNKPNKGQFIEFKTDHPLKFLGIGLYGGLNPAQYSLELRLAHAANGEVLHREIFDFFYNGAKIFEILFKTPIKLKASIDYEVCVKIQGPPTFYGKHGIENITTTLPHDRKVTVTFATVRRASNPLTSLSQGQIPKLIFST